MMIVIPKDMAVGTQYKTKRHGLIEIVEYNGTNAVTVIFKRTLSTRTVSANKVRRGAVKDFMQPTVHGVGLLGVGDHVASIKGKDTKAYKVWSGMLQRCYCEKYQARYPTYMGCTVCDEWHNFNIFADWFYENYIVGCHLDKDTLINGNKIYSPKSCVFITPKENTIKSSAKEYKVISPEGESVTVYNMSGFCEEMGLSRSRMTKVLSGKSSHHRGWKVSPP
jgi:hypothetical protein